MADSEAVRSKRKRHHQAGLHDLCGERCAAVRAAENGEAEPLLVTGGVGASVERLFTSAALADDYHAALAEIARLLAAVADTDPVRRVAALRELRGVLGHWEQPAGGPGSAVDRLRVQRHVRRLRAQFGEEIAAAARA